MKTINIKEKTWKKISTLRIRYDFKTMNDTLEALLKVMRDFKPEIKEEVKKNE
jgi:hypothetical protein